MIRLDDAHRPLLREFLEAPGGFAWWYLEILDEAQSGLVLIWSFGLPFLPGYMSEARKGQGQRPEERPSLNIALYERGRPIYYVLHEFKPEDVSWDGAGKWRFGRTEILETEADGQREVEIRLDCPVPTAGAPLTGRIRVAGPVPRLAPGVEGVTLGDSTHAWTPQTSPAFATAMLALGDGRRFSVSGRAYHDRNGSTRGLDALGIGTWMWGHASGPQGERIFYVLWPDTPEPGQDFECVGFEIDRQGLITPRRDLRLSLGGLGQTFYGMPCWPRVDLYDGDALWLGARLADPVDDGPFYLRYLTRAEGMGQELCSGSAEVIVPSRVDLTRHRFLVRMRVSTDARPNSFWLPLFQGAREDRLARMLRRAVGG